MRLRPLMRPLVRFLKYYQLQTHYVEGDGGSLIIGEKVSLCNTLVNVESGSVYIGNNTIFGYNVMLLTGRHDFQEGKRISVYLRELGRTVGAGVEVPRKGYDIRIGKNCWIASGVIISGGVNIGDSCIVAAGAVVVKDIPEFSIAAGVPARVISDIRDSSHLR